jgi:hypothetical protein
MLQTPEARAARRAQRRLGVRMRAAARIIAIPALIMMLYALYLFWRETWPFPRGAGATMYTIASTTTVPLGELLTSEDLLAANWWMSVSILALIALPGINVVLVLWENLRLRRWVDALAAAGVLALLLIGALSGKR